MQIEPLTYESELWDRAAAYAGQCSWSAGKSLAKRMRTHGFSEWERVFVALDGGQIAGYCTLSGTDCLPDVTYMPYVGFVFVGETYRGHRLSEKLILFALQYAKELGFNRVYLVSDHVNLYEKYGFVKVDEARAPWGAMETIFMHIT